MANEALSHLDPARHLLSDDHAYLIFHRIIRDLLEAPDMVSGASRPPVAKITGGQPGAGKSAIIEVLALAETRAPIIISGDEYRKYHPEYARLQRDDPLNAAFYTDRDAGRWTEMLIEEASDRRLDLVIESTMRQADTFRRTSALLHAKGYAVQAHVMAVRPSLSWLGVHLRFERAIALAGHGRFTTRASHDAAVAGLPATLGTITDERLAENISIWERGTENATFITSVTEEASSAVVPASVWLREFWSRPPSTADLSDLWHGWALVIDMMRRRNAPAVEIDEKQREGELALQQEARAQGQGN